MKMLWIFLLLMPLSFAGSDDSPPEQPPAGKSCTDEVFKKGGGCKKWFCIPETGKCVPEDKSKCKEAAKCAEGKTLNRGNCKCYIASGGGATKKPDCPPKDSDRTTNTVDPNEPKGSGGPDADR